MEEGTSQEIGKKLAKLKKKLTTETEFGRVFHYFFDNLGSDPAFLKAGETVEHPTLATIIQGATSEALRQNVKVDNLMLIKVASANFCHGSCFLSGRMATVLYFEDLNMGMIAISMALFSGQMSYIRFTGTTLSADKAPYFAGNVSKRKQ